MRMMWPLTLPYCCVLLSVRVSRHVDFAVLRIDGGPLGAVHAGGFGGVGRQTGVDANVGQAVEGVARRVLRADRHACGHVGVAQVEFQPGAGAVGVEARGINGAFVHVFGTNGQAVGAVGIRQHPQLLRHEFVDVFAARIAAGVERNRLAGRGDAGPGAFVGAAAQRGAFDGHRSGAVRIDFDDVAEGVGGVAEVAGAIHRFGWVSGDVPAAERGAGGVGGQDRRPAVVTRAAGRHAVSQQGRVFFLRAHSSVCATGEIAGPVFFGREVGAPGRIAVAAVVDGAAGLRAVV
jgi:hypothetical protein